MKKKMLFMAALAGVVTLASCVKDDESASVTAIRNAKANQLNADATLKEAQATNEAAQAAYNLAQTANETAQARANAVLADIAEATKASEIEKDLRGYQLQEAADAATLQNSLNNVATAERNAINNKYNAINAAVNAYTGLLAAYNAAVVDITTQKANLAKAKVDAEYAQQTQAAIITNAEQSIKASEALIEEYKKIQDTGMTNTEIANAINAKTAEVNGAESALNNSEAVKTFLAASEDYATKFLAVNEYTDDNGALGTDALFNKANSFGTLVFTPVGAADQNPATVKAYDKYIAYYAQSWPSEKADPNFNDGGYFGNIQKYRLVESNLTNKTADFDNTIKNLKTTWDENVDRIGTDKDTKDTKTKIYVDPVTKEPVQTFYARLAEYKENETTAKTALDAEQVKLNAAIDDLKAADALDDADATKPAKQLAAKIKIGDELKAIYGAVNGWVFPDPITTNADANNYIAPNYDVTWGYADITSENIKEVLGWYIQDWNTGAPTYVDRVDFDDYNGNFRDNDKLQADYDAAQMGVANTNQTIMNRKSTVAVNEAAYNDEVADKAKFEDAVKAVDLTAYDKACADLKASLEAFNKAAEALEAEEEKVDDMQNELAALVTIAGTGQDVPALIATEEANIANQQKAIANAKAANDPDRLIAQAEANLQQAENNLEVLQDRLDAAKEQLEALLAEDAEETADADADTEG